MRHYKSAEWGFEIDVPTRFNTFPPNPTNSPFEVVRFMSKEEGDHAIIVFRNPHDPKESLADYVIKTQATLAKAGFANFITKETTIGSAKVLALDFDKEREHDHWYVREYFIADGTLLYVLGFGTTTPDTMFDLYDRMAKSFVLDQ